MSDGTLSQEEIDSLLSIFQNETAPAWKSLKDFNTFLTARNAVSEKQYGIFDKDIAVCRFFDDKKGENILSDIMTKNTETGMGNVCIPNTNIKLINYSYCPECGKVHSYKDLQNYYSNPVLRTRQCLNYAFRKETRVICNDCGTPFIPTLIIADGTPKNSVQFLCRTQTVDAIEVFMDEEYHEQVLTRNRRNIKYREDGARACTNDLMISKLAGKPALISNFIQYSPPPMILNFINQTNMEKGDVLYGFWEKAKERVF